MAFGNRRALHRLGHCFPHSFRHPQRAPSETQILYTEIMLKFPRHVIFTAVMIFVFVFNFSETRLYTLLVSRSPHHSETLIKDCW